MAQYANGYKALALCDRCGFQYKLGQLKKLTITGRQTNLKVCPECWEKDHPQYRLGKMRLSEPIAIRDPRNANAEYAQSRAWLQPAPSLASTGFVGIVEVIV